MEDENRKIIVVFLGLILIVLILIAVLIVLLNPVKNIENSRPAIINYNPLENAPLYTTQKNVVHNPRNYDFVVYNYKTWDYSSYGQHSWRKDFVGTYVDEFRVYVKNEEREGNYFRVEFYFEDLDGDIRVENLIEYVPAREKVEFLYKDVQEEKYRYDDWSYKVFVEGENYEKEVKYYEINGKNTVFYDFSHNKCS